MTDTLPWGPRVVAHPSAVRAAYDAETKEMAVMFKDGTAYVYSDVQPLDFLNLCEGPNGAMFSRGPEQVRWQWRKTA